MAWAAEPDPPPEMLLFEEPIVVAAAKRAQSSREAPSAVTVITHEEIRRFGYRTLGEALRSAAGLYTSNDRMYTYLGVRGFLRPGDYNNRILLLINGHTYNDDIYGAALLGTEFGIDLEAVERIEVVRGPGSALYGGNAIFAVINVITATGSERPGVQPLVEAGSHGRKRGQISVGKRFDNGLDVFATGSVLDIYGNHTLFYPEYDDPTRNNGIARNADGERALNFFGRVGLGEFSLQGGINYRQKHVPTGISGTTFDDAGTKVSDSRQFAEAAYTTELPAAITLSSRLYYDGVRFHGTYIYGTDADRTKNEDHGKSHWLGGELRAERELFQGNQATLGSEYSYHPRVTQKNADVDGPTYLDDHRTYSAWGIYVQDEWHALPSVTLVGGVRYDHYYNQIERVTPRAAVLWSPRDDTTIKLLYGEAFRPPNMYEQYYASPALGYLSNSGLNPETIATYETVAQYDLMAGVGVIGSVYHYELSDLIDQTEVPGPEGQTFLQYQNLSSARATGFSLELQATLPQNVHAHGSYSFQDAVAAGGARLTNSPKHLGVVGALFPLPYALEGGAELLIVGPRKTMSGDHVDTETLANLTLNYAAPVPGLRLGAGLYNLFDQHYADPGTPDTVRDQIPQDGFTFLVQAAYAF